MFREVLYPKLKELKNDKEYLNALNRFNNYAFENNDLCDSISYDIEANEKRVTEYDISDFHDQFSNLKNIYTEVLRLADEIYIYPFWLDEEPMEVTDKKQIILQSLNIDDLLFLPYKHLLKINLL